MALEAQIDILSVEDLPARILLEDKRQNNVNSNDAKELMLQSIEGGRSFAD